LELNVEQVFNLPRGSLGRSNLRPVNWLIANSIGSPALEL